MEQLFEHIPMVMGVITFIGGGMAWYNGYVRKNYASERDFGHLKTSYQAIGTNIQHLDTMLDQRLDAMEREQMKVYSLLYSLVARFGAGAIPNPTEPED